MSNVANVSSYAVELLPAGGYEACYVAEYAVIGFSFDVQTGVHAIDTDKQTNFRSKANGLAYVPHGCPVYSQSKRGGEYLKITIPELMSPKLARERRFSDVVDHDAVSFAHELRRMLLKGTHVDALEFEYFVQGLVHRATHVAGADRVVTNAERWMTARRLGVIDEIIEAQMAEGLAVEELSKMLGLSAGFFSRAFKAAVGKAPHDYIVDRRIARARGLLRVSGHAISDVAFSCGFSSHAHMTAVFKRRIGVTPREMQG